MTATLTEITVEDLNKLVGDFAIPCYMPNLLTPHVQNTTCDHPATWLVVVGTLPCRCPGMTVEVCDTHKEKLCEDEHWHCPNDHCFMTKVRVVSVNRL